MYVHCMYGTVLFVVIVKHFYVPFPYSDIIVCWNGGMKNGDRTLRTHTQEVRVCHTHTTAM